MNGISKYGTPQQAEVLNQVHRASQSYHMAASRVSVNAARIVADLNDGIHPQGTHRQAMTDLIEAEARFLALAEMGRMFIQDTEVLAQAFNPTLDVYWIADTETD